LNLSQTSQFRHLPTQAVVNLECLEIGISPIGLRCRSGASRHDRSAQLGSLGGEHGWPHRIAILYHWNHVRYDSSQLVPRTRLLQHRLLAWRGRSAWTNDSPLPWAPAPTTFSTIWTLRIRFPTTTFLAIINTAHLAHGAFCSCGDRRPHGAGTG